MGYRSYRIEIIGENNFYQQLEALSGQLLWDFIIVIPILLLWASFPDLAAAVTHIIGERIVNILYGLPLSRVLENEADEVGLKLAAKVCYTSTESKFYILYYFTFCIVTVFTKTNS